MKTLIIKLTPDESEHICRGIFSKLSDWLAIPEANESYAKGIRERLSFACVIDQVCVGILSLEFPFDRVGNIYWMGVHQDWHHKDIGTALLRHAEMICTKRHIDSLSVKILRSKDRNSLKTFEFFLFDGFRQLFEVNMTYSEYPMAYLNKTIQAILRFSLGVLCLTDLCYGNRCSAKVTISLLGRGSDKENFRNCVS